MYYSYNECNPVKRPEAQDGSSRGSNGLAKTTSVNEGNKVGPKEGCEEVKEGKGNVEPARTYSGSSKRMLRST